MGFLSVSHLSLSGDGRTVARREVARGVPKAKTSSLEKNENASSGMKYFRREPYKPRPEQR